MDSFSRPEVDYDAPENSDVMASQIIGDWELLIVLVPNGTLSNGDTPNVISMQVTRQVVVAVEQDYFNRRIDECLEITHREANEEDWINNFEGDELPRLIGERTSLHALADAIEMGQTAIEVQDLEDQFRVAS